MFLILLLIHLENFAATDWDTINYDPICATDLVSTIAVVPSIKNEVLCQAECTNLHSCSHFTYFTSSTEPPTTSCALYRSCPTNTTTKCSRDPGCSMAVTGPQTPSILDSCCTGLTNKACQGELLAQYFDSNNPADCQRLCREKGRCKFYTQYSDTVCLLYAGCQTTKPCSVCTSGPVSPGWNQCMEQEGQETLLMGGWTDTEEYATSIELVTDSVSCLANMPETPVGALYPAATVIGR